MTQSRPTANSLLLEKFIHCIKDQSSIEIATFIKALMKLAPEQDPETYQNTFRSIIATQYASAYIKECTRSSGLLSKLQKGKSTLKIIDEAIETFNKTETLFKRYEDYIPEEWSKTTEGHVFMSACDQRDLLQMIFDKLLFALYHNHQDEFVFAMLALGMTGRTGLGVWHTIIKEKLHCNREMLFGNRFVDGFFTEAYLRNTLYAELQSDRSTVRSAVAAYYKEEARLPEEKSMSSSGRFFKLKPSWAQVQAERVREQVKLEELHRNYPGLEL